MGYTGPLERPNGQLVQPLYGQRGDQGSPNGLLYIPAAVDIIGFQSEVYFSSEFRLQKAVSLLCQNYRSSCLANC